MLISSARATWRAALVAALVAASLEAQRSLPLGPRQLSFESFGAKEGLESLTTTDLLESRWGDLWIATQEGVVRFDGQQFETFDRGRGLPSPAALTLEQDAAGVLWAGTTRGLAWFDGERFHELALPGEAAGEAVAALTLDRNGELIAGTVGGAFRCAVDACTRIWAIPPPDSVSALTLDPSTGELWFAGPFGLVRWNGQEMERYGREHGLPSLAFRSLLVDARGVLWIRLPETIVRLDTNDGTVVVDNVVPRASDPCRLFQDRRGVLWSTSSAGLLYRDGASWRRLGSETGLPSEATTAIVEDHEGSLWIGSAHEGIARWLGRDRFEAWTTRTGLPSELVLAVARTRGGRLAFGTQAGLAVVDRESAQVLVYGLGRGASDTPVTALAPDSEGGLWFATIDSQIAYLDSAGRVTAVQTLPSEIAVERIVVGPDGRVWLATGAGLWSGFGRPPALRFERVTVPHGDGASTASTAPSREQFADLLFDRSGALWAAGRLGLARLERGEWTRWTRADGLLDDHLVSLAQAGDGTLWLGYRESHGVSEIRFAEGSLQFRHFGRENGLRHDQVTFVRSDALGRIWVGTTRGISVRVGARFENFGLSDGMRGEETLPSSFLADRDGTIWVGTSNGAVAARLSEADLRPQPALASRIRSAALGGVRFDSATTPEVAFERGVFEVVYDARTFRTPREVYFRYRLAGIDESWVETQSRSQRYAALPAGGHRFEVISRLDGGVWGAPATVQFTVLRPWWASTLARLAALAAAALLGILVDRWRSFRERRARHLLEEAVAARTKELAASREQLEQKNEELAQLALTDPLTGLKNRRYAWEFLAAEVTRVDHEWQSAAGESPPEARLVFFLMDVDLFKDINDRYGHEIGDQVLIEAAERVREVTRLSDIAVRWGGEEFLVVARDLPAAEWSSFAARLREAIATPPYRITPDREPIRCTASLGYAAYPFDSKAPIDWQHVFRLADLALYAVKQCGRKADLGVEPGAGWKGHLPLDLLASQASGVLHLRWGRVRAQGTG